jgi:hypothetical protein
MRGNGFVLPALRKDYSPFTTSFTGTPSVLQSPVSIAVQTYATKF